MIELWALSVRGLCPAPPLALEPKNELPKPPALLFTALPALPREPLTGKLMLLPKPPPVLGLGLRDGLAPPLLLLLPAFAPTLSGANVTAARREVGAPSCAAAAAAEPSGWP